MKLRINGDSLRLRLSQREVEEFSSEGKTTDSICFGGTTLNYELRKADSFSSKFSDQKIVIEVPSDIGAKWAISDQVAIEKTISVGDGGNLSILVEKDFKCLTDRPNEDESDLFENPMNKHDC